METPSGKVESTTGTIKIPPLSAQPLDVRTSDLLLRVYLTKRLQGQIDFYRSRVREYDSNASFMMVMGALIMAVSAVVSTLGAAENSPELALVTAMLPAVAALIGSFRQLYQWEKQSSLYRDAILGLEEAKLITPDDDVYDPKQALAYLPVLVEAAEQVFMGEINQWGQVAMGKGDDNKDNLAKALDELALTDEDQKQATEIQEKRMTGEHPTIPGVS
ncbi:MAG: SLATT domain-containing protein [Anaerolineae bacterium]|nr:SLATT domain-containing protein [Anaerolineae bacterium]